MKYSSRVHTIARAPIPRLRPFVRSVWASAQPREEGGGSLERVLPTGCMHLVVRVASSPLTVFTDESRSGERLVGRSVVGGARSTAYVREVTPALRTVGVMLAPGAGALLFGLPARELAEAHTSLDDLWGRDSAQLRERLAACGTIDAQLALVEAALAMRLRDVSRIDPVVTDAVARFEGGARIGDVVARSGYSHRAFIVRFRDAVGLAPKTFCRVLRSQRAVVLLAERKRSLADVAASAGYADQAHLTRQFATIVGLSPARYRAANPATANHVPIGAKSETFKTPRARSAK